MKYLGGKSRIARPIAQTISPSDYWWDPFCGGLSVSVALASIYPNGLVSDANPALISLYEAVREGWSPPTGVSREQWGVAKSLPDTDPLKAFCGVGCSFQGMWFSSYYGPRLCPPSRTHPKGMRQDPVKGATDSLRRDLGRLQGCDLLHLDFFDIEPTPNLFEVVYCDPPYAGTTGYDAIHSPFDHSRFWSRCIEWTSYSRVYASELACPVPSEVVWERDYERRLGARGQANGSQKEKLFRVLSPAAAVR